jgi:short-chain fatty acids transporter
MTRSAAERVGLWKLLEVSMQMCLILVTGHALAVTKPVKALIDAVARIPRTTGTAAAMVSTLACAFALINWGLGLIVGALLAREVGKSMQQRGITAHYPLICAAGYMGLMVWHGGLSGSAPLSMTTADGAAKVLPRDVAAQLPDGIPLNETLFSPLNLFVTLACLSSCR